MKQLLFPLLFLPCLALAQYPANAGQKITLGEQTTADGLIFRGVAADTTLTVKSDTAAYFVLDTVNLNLYTYKASASGRKWRQLGADTAAIAYVNTYGAQTVNGAKTFTSAVTATRFNPTSNDSLGNGFNLSNTNEIAINTNGVNRLFVSANGDVGIGKKASNFTGLTFVSPFFDIKGNLQIKANSDNGISNLAMGGLLFRKLSIVTSIDNETPLVRFFVSNNYNSSNVSSFMTIDSSRKITIPILSGSGDRTVMADANGLLSAPTSSINTKENVQILNYGLNEILQINPVSFDYIDKYKWGKERKLGFIIEDIFPIVPEVTGIMDNGDLYLDMVKLIPIVTKAIQEQQALIKALEQRILTLENK